MRGAFGAKFNEPLPSFVEENPLAASTTEVVECLTSGSTRAVDKLTGAESGKRLK